MTGVRTIFPSTGTAPSDFVTKFAFVKLFNENVYLICAHLFSIAFEHTKPSGYRRGIATKINWNFAVVPSYANEITSLIALDTY